MSVREFSAPPRMLPLFARAGVALIPGAARLPFIGGWGGEIPELEFVLAVTAGNYAAPDQWMPPIAILREVFLASLDA